MRQMKPFKIRLEASSCCQLQCPACPNASKAIHSTVGSGFLRLKDFQKLLAECPWLKEIELSNYGEIFLNPDMLGIMECAYERDVALTANNGVNLNSVSERVLEGLVKCKFRSLTCSIDGASDETYSVYRVKGTLATVIENIGKINAFKQKHESKYPQLTWQFLVFGFNEHEIPLARQLAGDLDMKFHLKLPWNPDFSPIRDQEFVRKEIAVVSRDEYKQKYAVDYMQSICHQLWDQPQVNWDGKMLGCCRNFWGDFGGNAFDAGLLESFNNEKMKYAREMLLGKKVAKNDIPCTMCDIYLGMKADGRWLRRRSLCWPLRALRFVYCAFGLRHPW